MSATQITDVLAEGFRRLEELLDTQCDHYRRVEELVDSQRY